MRCSSLELTLKSLMKVWSWACKVSSTHASLSILTELLTCCGSTVMLTQPAKVLPGSLLASRGISKGGVSCTSRLARVRALS